MNIARNLKPNSVQRSTVQIQSLRIMKNDANTCRAYLGKMCDEQTDVTYLSNLGNLIVAAIEGLPEFFRQSACQVCTYNSDLIMYPK